MASTARTEPDLPGPHHDPPPELSSVALPLETTDRYWFRSHPAGREPLFFGRSQRNRFDAPDGSFGTLYLGQDEHCVFVETFGHSTGAADLVTLAALEARELSRIEPKRRLRLVDLSGPGLARLRADARLCTGSIFVAQRWALALAQHPERPDGIYYRSRHDPERFCAAVFDRASHDLEAISLGTLADPSNRDLLAGILDTYEVGLIDS